MRQVAACIATVLIIIFVFSIVHPVFAQSVDETQQRLQDLQQEINNLTAKLNSAKDQEKTLQSQLDYIDTQATITKLKIEQTNTQLSELQSEINNLSEKITRLSMTVDSLTNILLNRIIQTYKYGNNSPLELLFSANGFSDLLMRAKYIAVAQENDKRILYQLQATKAAYHDQQQDKQTREQQAEKLKTDLQTYQAQLNADQTAKSQLLKVTQNNEAIYYQKLKAAQEEQNAILSIINGGGREVVAGPAKEGDIIGTIISGPSACSSGTHLHFEVHQNDYLVNPTQFLANHSLSFDNSPDNPFSFSGSWNTWPLFDPITITQGFGNTWWAAHGWYTNPPGHTGIDMYSETSLKVRAVQSGTLSIGSIACGGGTLHYKKIDQSDSITSYYLHVL